MKITDIKQQVKRASRYSIYVDEKYSFSLSESELLGLRLHIGQEFAKDELENLHKTAVEDKALMRAYDLLARRPRSTWEMHDYLKRKDYDELLIKKILNMLSDRGLLDDKKFAQAWVDNRRLLKPVSKRRLMQELQQKRISKNIIVSVLDAEETDERGVLKQLVEKKRSIPRFAADEQKLIAYLMRQGFRYDDIKAVLNDEDDD